MYAYSNRDVPYLRSYVKALAVYESVTPLKSGQHKGLRPVGARRKTYQRIWTTPDGAVKVTESWREGYVASEVTFYPNGMITVTSPNGSLGLSSLGFIGKLLGIELNHRGSRLWIHNVYARKRDKRNRTQAEIFGSFPLLNNNLRLRQDGHTGKLYVEDSVFPQVRIIDRAGAKQIRAQYANFVSYAKGLYGLLDHGFSKEENTHDDHLLVRDELLPLIISDAPDDHLRAAKWFAMANRSYRYSWRGNAEDWRDTAKRALVDLDKFILDAHPDQAYAWETRYDGKVYTGPMKLGS